MSYNIRHGGVGRAGTIASLIRACTPDIVLLQEAIRPEVVEALSSATGLGHWGAKRGRSLAFLSRLPVAHVAWRRSFWSRHAFLELTPADLDVRLFGVHLSALHAQWTERRRTLELRALLEAIRAHAPGFHVIAGDFNSLPPGDRLDMHRLPRRLRPFVWLSGGSIRWRAIDTILGAGYVDAWTCLHPGAPGMPTFPTWDPHLRLDYVFVPAAFATRLSSCDVVNDAPNAAAGSDHFPLLARLSVEPRTATDQI